MILRGIKYNMKCKREKGTFSSCNGIDTIAYYVYLPQEQPRAILQIAHGLSEHFGRYDEIASYLAEQGFLVCGNDHLGHGMTSPSSEDLGYFGDENGWAHMVDDMHILTYLMKNTYGELPYFIMGYSMGSMLARAYITCYGEDLAGCILVGVSGRNQGEKIARPFIKLMRKLRGNRYRSKFLYILAFANYNKKFGEDCDRLQWMSRDPKVLADYRSDPLCNFIVTVSGFQDLMQVLNFVTRKEWAEEVPKGLPIYLVSGNLDPVGDYGKGVQQVYKELLNVKIKDLSMKLYPDDHHDVLNEPNKEIVYKDIVNWMIKHLHS